MDNGHEEVYFGRVKRDGSEINSDNSYFVFKRSSDSLSKSKIKWLFAEVGMNFVQNYLKGATIGVDPSEVVFYNGVSSTDSITEYSSLKFLPLNEKDLEEVVKEFTFEFKKRVYNSDESRSRISA